MKQDDRSDWTYGERTTGTVVRLVLDRGFVFIRAGENDYFLHHSEYDGEFLRLSEKTVLTFIPAQTPKGLRAIQAERVL